MVSIISNATRNSRETATALNDMLLNYIYCLPFLSFCLLSITKMQNVNKITFVMKGEKMHCIKHFRYYKYLI